MAGRPKLLRAGRARAALWAQAIAVCFAVGATSPAEAGWAAPAPDARDQLVLEACGPGGRALHAVARSVALRSLEKKPSWNTMELGQRLRALGEPHPGARAWTLRAPRIDRGHAAHRLGAWLASHDDGGRRRCGVASIEDSERGEVLAVVTVPVHADLVRPVPASVPQGRWVTVDAVMRERASGGKVMVLGPRGAPRTIPTSFDPATGRIVARFMADREGLWLLQLIATTQTGPRPVLEAQVRVGDRKVVLGQPAPGEERGRGLADDSAIFAKLNAARASEGVSPLARDPVLDEVALDHVRSMMAAGVVAHDVGNGAPPERAAKAGISSSEVGENVSRASSAALVHRALWSSLSHRANTLHPRYERVGVAALRDPRGVLWVAQVFAGR